MADLNPTEQLYIHGKRTDAASGETFATVNPATGDTLCRIQTANAADVDRAAASAKEGFRVWSRTTGAERGRILNRAANIMRERNDELARLEVLDTGKPISEAAEVDVQTGADAIEYYAGLAAGLHGEHYDLGSAFAYTRREPLGVCAGIGAWNYPIQIAGWKSGPALACGNAMVFKPAELTPLTAFKLAEIFTEAGLPDGVFNVVQGEAETGRALSTHPDIAKVSLTGEVGTGKKVMADAAGTLKYVTMELGGKSPLIVFDDADIDNAVSAALLGNFFTQGEVCTNGTRVFIHRAIRETFIERLLERTQRIRIGDPLAPDTQLGALISRDHMRLVLDYIDSGKSEGATLLCGGRRASGAGLGDGCFVEPTIFADCHDDMTIVREEIFGPVMALLDFDDEADVIHRANNTPYGLAAGVFTRDLARAHRVVTELEAGICWINNYNQSPVEMPVGGYKQSGIGRENGPAAIEHYTQLKSVFVETGDVDAPF